MNNGDTPHILYGAQQNYKRLFFSDYDQALIVPITISPGFGVIQQGTAMAKNISAAGNLGKHVPYNPTTFTGAEVHPGRSYLLQSIASGSTDNEFYVTNNDSYKYVFGDDVIVNDNNETAVNLGAISAIDRASYSHMTKITTTVGGSATFATSEEAYLAHEAGVSGNNYSDCVGLLARAVETGTGEKAQGGIGQLIISNALLYTGMLVNFDAAAVTDVGSSTYGQFTLMK